MSWIYKGKVFDITPENYESFVYVITNLLDGRRYIGKKIFWTKKTLPPLKGQKKKRKLRNESDWREYFGSSEELKNDVLKFGESNFKREILVLCETRAISSYLEAKLQFQFEVLEKPELFYNRNIMCKLHINHIKKLVKA